MSNDPSIKKILILAGNPKNTVRLGLDEEVRDIKEGLLRSPYRDKFDIRDDSAVRPRDIRRAILDYRPNIIHFSGHGSGDKGLSFEDVTGEEKLVTGEALAGLFGQFSQQIECVLLNACYSEVQADVIVEHINYVIGMNDSLQDTAAIEFAVGFYDGLAAYNPEYDGNSSVEFAFNIARNAITLNGISGESIPQLKKKINLTNLITEQQSLAKLFNVPKLPPNFLPRDEQFQPLKQKVLSHTNQPVGITSTTRRVGLQGMGGIGKTVLATALARDEDIRKTFFDGIFWITLGQTPKLLDWQLYLSETLADNQATFTEISFGKAKLKQLFADKSCLLILDDIWNLNHARTFDVLGEKCQMLVTTRDTSIITSLGAVAQELAVLSHEQSLTLLADWAGYKDNKDNILLPPEANQVVEECGNLPLALSMVGAMLRGKPNRWGNVLHKLRSANLDKIRQQFPDYPYPDLLKAIQVSVETLEADTKEKYFDFAIFSEDTAIPEQVLQIFWQAEGLDEYDTQDVVDELANKSLVSTDEDGKLRLHDLQLDYLRKQTEDLSTLHNRFLQAYSQKYSDGWHTLENDGYIYQYLSYHFQQAQREDELQQLLLDFRWLKAKLENTNLNALIADYNLILSENNFDRQSQSPQDKSLQLVKGALQLSVHILAGDKNQLPGQLFGRLLSFQNPEIQHLLQQAKNNQTSPWLRPLITSLTPPGKELIATFQGHSNSVVAVAYAPDGKRAISASYDKTLKLWNLQTGEIEHTFQGHSDWVNAVAYAPDGKQAISASDDKTLKLWNLQTGEIEHTFQGHSNSVVAVAYAPDGKRAISASDDKTLKLWNLQTGEIEHTFQGHSNSVYAVAYAPDGKQAISASDDKTLKLWNLQTGEIEHTFQGHSNSVVAVAYAPDGKRAISASDDQTLKLWNLETGEIEHTFQGHSDSVVAVAYAPDGKQAISASVDQTLKLWNLQTGEIEHTFQGHSDWVVAVAYAPDGKQAISASDDKTLKLWNLQTGEIEHTFQGHSHSNWVNAVAYAPDGKRAISASHDQTLKLWNLETGEIEHTFQGHSNSVNAVAYAPDGKRAISASDDKTLKLWNLETGEIEHTFQGHSNWVVAVGYAPDGKRAISASYDKTLKLWNLETGEIEHTFQGHSNSVNAVAYAPDGKRAISASYDKTLKLWNLQTGEIEHTFQGHSNWVNAVAYAPDGKRAISASHDQTLKLWNLETGEIEHTFQGHSDSVYAVAYAPDGKRAISASHDQTLKLWNLEIGEIEHTFQGHSDSVYAVAYAPDGKRAISASRDQTLKLWNLQTREEEDTFTGEAFMVSCAVAPDGLTIVAGDVEGSVHFLRLEEGN